jgi:hypothetical protein
MTDLDIRRAAPDTPGAAAANVAAFTRATGWRVKWREPMGCWHLAVGRRCVDIDGRPRWSGLQQADCPDHVLKLAWYIVAGPAGPADHFYTNPVDHPRRAWSATGERVLLCSPYVLDQRGAAALTRWCEQRLLTWSAVPACWYWPGRALSVVIRSADPAPRIHAWVPEAIS